MSPNLRAAVWRTLHDQLETSLDSSEDKITKKLDERLNNHRFALARVLIAVFAFCFFGVTGFALYSHIHMQALIKPSMLINCDADKIEAAIDQIMRPLEFINNFLAGVVLPVITLVIGFYFGRNSPGFESPSTEERE